MADQVDAIFDFSLIEEMDPSLVDGYHILYDREVPMEIRHKDAGGNETSSVESIKVKILAAGPETSPISIRMELSSEVDLFFYYIHELNEASYLKVKTAQNFLADFCTYPAILVRMLNSCIREPNVYIAVYSMLDEVNGKLDVIQNMEYKFVELLSCSFERSSAATIQNQISYRYNAMKQRLSTMQARVFEIVNLVKTKNPSLLLQLQKNSATSNSSTSTVNVVSGSSDRKR